MRHFTPIMATAVVAMLAACTDAGPVQPPQPLAPTSLAASKSADEGVRRIDMLDACDPDSFNAAVGAGTCVRAGGMTFDTFIARLTARHKVEAWRFSPSTVNAKVGQTLLATNRGGEVHTFTEVAHFGGGIVPSLNQLSGNTVVAPECMALAPDDFIAPGDTDSDDEVEKAGTELYQCCIHPWMRTTIVASGG